MMVADFSSSLLVADFSSSSYDELAVVKLPVQDSSASKCFCKLLALKGAEDADNRSEVCGGMGKLFRCHSQPYLLAQASLLATKLLLQLVLHLYRSPPLDENLTPLGPE